MTVREMQKKYGLSKDDFWELKRGNRSIWVVTHNACEKIQAQEGIVIGEPVWLKVLEGDKEHTVVQASAWKLSNGEVKIWSTGETSKDNYKTSERQDRYPIALAEKRLKDRLILKLIEAYQFGIYSEVESDEFRQPAKQQPTEPPEAPPETQPAPATAEGSTGKTRLSREQAVEALLQKLGDDDPDTLRPLVDAIEDLAPNLANVALQHWSLKALRQIWPLVMNGQKAITEDV